MNIDSAFPSKYLKASDLGGRTARVTIRACTMEDVGRDDRKPVLYFEGKEKGLVLNRTNSQAISMVFGQETDDWAGGEIELFTVMTDYQGQAREAIRVRIAPRKPAANSGRAPAVKSGGATWTANARDDARVQAGMPDDRVPSPAAEPGNAPFDDEIPFAPEWR